MKTQLIDLKRVWPDGYTNTPPTITLSPGIIPAQNGDGPLKWVNGP